MFEHVAVAAQDDGGDLAAARVAASLVDQGGRLTLLRVAARDAVDVSAELLGADADEAHLQRLLPLALVRARDGVSVRVRTAVGSVDDVLPRLALDERPDALVLGLGGRRRTAAWRALHKRVACPRVLVDTATPTKSGRRPSGWRAMPGRPASLLWQLFAANAAVMTFATLLLVLSPARVSEDPVATEVAVLGAGLMLLLAVHLLTLRRTLAPLRRATAIMTTVDARRPGPRLPEDGRAPAEVAALARSFNAMVARLEDERRSSARRSLRAQEDERARIAREIHDQIGQTFTAIALQAERAVDAERERRAAALRAIEAAAREGLDEVRRMGRELRPEALDDLGLGNALIVLGRRLAAHSGVRVQVRVASGMPALRSEAELVLYRVAQEAMSNALRHAGARQIDVRLVAEDGEVAVEVTDDGRGLPAVLPEGTAGLDGMRERALLVEGSLEIGPGPGGGTRVVLRIPAEMAVAAA